MKAKEISLIELMLEILLHWRRIIVLALVGGFFLEEQDIFDPIRMRRNKEHNC